VSGTGTPFACRGRCDPRTRSGRTPLRGGVTQRRRRAAPSARVPA
jgi:hypothetical protein